MCVEESVEVVVAIEAVVTSCSVGAWRVDTPIQTGISCFRTLAVDAQVSIAAHADIVGGVHRQTRSSVQAREGVTWVHIDCCNLFTVDTSEA